MRGDPFFVSEPFALPVISTHSPRAGRSQVHHGAGDDGEHFNSLAPCGAIPTSRSQPGSTAAFQLTRPVRGDPLRRRQLSRSQPISTHSPRAGRSKMADLICKNKSNFNSLAPCGAIPVRLYTAERNDRFQLTRPVWGEPHVFRFPFAGNKNFNSLAPCGANHICIPFLSLRVIFQLTRPVWGEPNVL